MTVDDLPRYIVLIQHPDGWTQEAGRPEEPKLHEAVLLADVRRLLEATGPPTPDPLGGTMTTPHPPAKPRHAFQPHRRGEPYWLTDGYGYGTEVSALRWWWRRLVEAIT